MNGEINWNDAIEAICVAASVIAYFYFTSRRKD